VRIPRPFDPIEVRVLGALLEKEQTTPDYYPLTLNALVAACNQRSNREPVMQLTVAEVRSALERLSEDVLVWRVEGSRADRWKHNLDRRWQLGGADKAVITLLMLRGAQTPGELRSRSERLRPFRNTEEVEAVLERLATDAEPMAVQLPRQPGQREVRWSHLLSGEPVEMTTSELTGHPSEQSLTPQSKASGSLADRVTALEERVAQLEAILTTGKENGSDGGG
jgi:hypothetical protein